MTVVRIKSCRVWVGLVAVAMLTAATLDAGQLRADEEARQTIEKAIEATGGLEAMQKANAFTYDEEGTYYGMGEGMPYTGQYAIQYPNQFKMDIQDVFVIVLDKDQGWVKTPEGVTELTEDQVKMYQDQVYVSHVGEIYPVLRDSFELEYLGEQEVRDQALVGVKVSHEGRPEVTLYFDPKTNLLSAMAYEGPSAEQPDTNVKMLTVLSEYKELEGIKYPAKVTAYHNDEMFVEANMVDYKRHESLPANTFAKPE